MNTRTKIKNILNKILPKSIFTCIRNIYIKNIASFFSTGDNAIIEKYTRQIIKNTGYAVIDGPFKGLSYVQKAIGSSFLHKLAGYYEAVLIPYIEEARTLPVRHILDIGSAEGYYTTGFGRIFPAASISAFEMDTQGRALIQEMHALNNLRNPIRILPEATSANIVTEIKENTLLICDCEGAEKTILDIANKDAFSKVVYGIIELHDEMVPGCKEAVMRYFSNTHTIEIVKFKFANPNDFAFLKNITDKKDLYTLLRERGIQDQEWAILIRK